MMMRTATIFLIFRCAAAVGELASKSGTKTKVAEARTIEQAQNYAKAGTAYTMSAEALKAKVQAEAQKVENARVASHQSLAQMKEAASTMTQAARLQEMAGLQEGGMEKGMEMIKSLGAEAKDALAGVQKRWLDLTHESLERFQKITEALPKGVEAMDPEKENAHIGAFMPIEEIVVPFMNHLKEIETSMPELKPWTSTVSDFTSFLETRSLEEGFQSNLPRFRTYKKEFLQYSQPHQEKLLKFMEEFEMDDILTVLQSPEF